MSEEPIDYAKVKKEYEAKHRPEFEAKYGQVWDTEELQKDFAVESFLAPFVFVRRKIDGMYGSLSFTASPRFYYSFCPDILRK